MIRKFHLQRDEDESGVSGTGRVAEGVVFSNGWVAMTWLTRHTSAAVYTSLHEVEAIHGHSGKTKVVMDEEDDYTYEPLEYRRIFEIGRAENGWTAREYETGSLIVASEESCGSEHKAFLSFLWSVVSHFGPSDGKYSPERITVGITPGSDCEGAKIENKEAIEGALQYLDFSGRFLSNLRTEDESLKETISKIDEIYSQLSSKIYGCGF